MKKNGVQTREEPSESLPALIARGIDDLAELFDAKLALLKLELREDLEAYLRGGTMIAIGAIVAAVGFALLNVAIAFFIAALFDAADLTQPVRYALGFLITAIFYLIGGATLIIINKNKLAEQDILPEQTIEELKQDKAALEKEI
ncbi:MAG: phage holin family protein [Acidobacteria bacterium]|nr:phage holin family protein [Acidobacteriota bacterium]